MLILQDDGCLYVYDSPQEVATSIEALDAEECIRRAFDDDAVPYAIEWIEPNKYGRTLWIIRWFENGRYRLVPAGPPDPEGLRRLLRTARRDLPPDQEAAVRAVEDGLSAKF